jgi:hypothetical protein
VLSGFFAVFMTQSSAALIVPLMLLASSVLYGFRVLVLA